MNSIKTYLLSEKLHGFLIAALLVSIPLPYAYSTTIIIIVLAASLYSSFYHKIIFKKEFLIPILFYLLMVISLLWSINLDKSLRGLERQIFFLLIPLSFILMPHISRKVLLHSLYVFAVSLAVYCLLFTIYAGILVVSNEDNSVFYYHTLVAPLELNAIYISTMTSLSLLYIIFYRKRTLINLALIGILIVFLMLLTSKNIILITAVAALIGWGMTKKFKLKSLVVLVVFGLIVLLFNTPLKKRWDTEFNSDIKEVITCDGFHKFYPWTGTTLRIFQARIFYELIQEKDVFFTGFGINASQEQVAEKQKYYQLWKGYNVYNFHNQYIQTFAELGFIGFLFIVLFLIIILRNYWKQKELMNLFFFLIMASVFITETYVWRQRGMIHFLVIYCLLIKIQSTFIQRKSNMGID